MNRILSAGFAFTLFLVLFVETADAQRNCGNPTFLENMKRDFPAFYQQKQAEKTQRIVDAVDAFKKAGERKTTAQYPIPVVFHFLVTDDEYSYLGEDSGIIRRVKAQLKQLNADFNGANTDQNLIPPAFKPLFANANIKFGLAKGTSANIISPGIEVKRLAAPSIYDVNNDCYTAKQNTPIGLAAWDATKYLNIWVLRITNGGSGTVLGITCPPSNAGYNSGTLTNPHIITSDDFGIVLNYGAFGVREFPAQKFITNIDRGRTLTHEMGHYFELSHTWGDDGGMCPGKGGQDDGISDTPPEADSKYGAPVFPLFDACTIAGNGVMFMNYMDYVDDRAMQMFTKEQGSRMQAFLQPGQESYSLTQNPGLALGVNDHLLEEAFSVVPNPATSNLHLTLSGESRFLSAEVMNMLGQTVAHIKADGSKSLDIAVGNVPRGIYLLKCQFAEGTLTRKIVLQ